MTTNLLGRWSAFAVFLVGLAYAVTLVAGFISNGLSKPIDDPLLAIMEALTLLSAPIVLIMMTAIQSRAPRERKAVSSVALAFTILATGTTSAVHFVELTAMRQLGVAGIVWPSTAYALELLAWDLFLGLSLVFAAASFGNSDRERRVARGLLLSGTLCLLGLLGPAVGNMRLQLVGVLGYGGVFPLVSLLVAKLFREDLMLKPGAVA